jgi:RNA polymerase sigma-70 factor (ECF subfamily)
MEPDNEKHDFKPEELIAQAKKQAGESVGAVLEHYRNYLNVLAAAQIRRKLQRRVSSSDIVQETMLRACVHFDQFRGSNEQELLAWLRQILVNSIANAVEKHFKAARRDIRREAQFGQIGLSLEKSALCLENLLQARTDPPSLQARRKEEVVILSDKLATLSKDYRDVLIFRHLQGQEFNAIAKRMKRSVPATRMLWLRALEKLRAAYASDDGTDG